MDTFRKWWNKPKADDQSLLARFYFADESLTAVATELDSFDGRAEPERCSRLVARLRQGQDQVLSITNVIMDELLADDRTPRAFRAKFPEEVLQESLAGQLWFGAECLAAGSSIMNREQESAAMRPLAKVVTKSLDNVRNRLREQCLRIKTPNATRLQLDANDAFTETLCESLKIFDRVFAEFELLYVSAMVQVKTIQEHESQEMICVLFSETLQRALRVGRLHQDQVDYFDPALMFSIPRLAIVAGLVIFPRGPLNMSHGAENLSEMFRPFRTLLVKIRDLLRTLTAAELNQLEQLLCTSEEIGGGQQQQQTAAAAAGSLEAAATTTTMTTTALVEISSPTNSSQQQQQTTTTIATSNCNSNCDDETPSAASSDRNLDANNDQQLVISKYVITDESTNYDDTTTDQNRTTHFNANSASSLRDIDVDLTAWHSEAIGDDRPPTETGSMHASITSAEGASGYFLSNTNLGQLLQPVETPLTDRFGPVSDADDDDDCNPMNAPGSSGCLGQAGGTMAAAGPPPDSGLGSTAEDTSLDRSPDSEVSATQMPPTTEQSQSSSQSSNRNESSALNRKYTANWERLKATTSGRQQQLDQQQHQQQPQQRRRHSMSTADPHRQLRSTNSASRRSNQPPRTSQLTHHRGDVAVSATSFDKHSARRAAATAARAAARAAAKAESVAAAAAATAIRLSTSPSSSSSSASSSSSYMSASATASPTSSAATRSSSVLQQFESVAATSLAGNQQSAGTAGAASDAGSSRQAPAVGGSTSADNCTVHSTRKKRSSAAKYAPDSSSGDDDTSSSSLSDSGETRAVQKQLAVRAAGRMKFKSTENLLHRLFVCIAGVADQLQTNFASDLRQILRSVFLMNMSPASDDDDDDDADTIKQRPKDADGPAAADLFEFRASEQDVVIQRDEREGSNQSIYSVAEEANAEDSSGADSVFGADGGADAEAASGAGGQHHRQERSASFEAAAHHRQALLRQAAAAAVAGAAGGATAGAVAAAPARTRSLGEESSATDSDEGGGGNCGVVGGRPYTPENELRRSAAQAVRVPLASATGQQQQQQQRGSGASSLAGSHGSTGAGSPPHNPHRAQTMAAMAAAAAASAAPSATVGGGSGGASTPSVQPPRWIPDEEAPRCMACAQSFTTFRRRHHCRNCGGVFCGVCSAASAPLPKFGLIKAVRVCRDCFVHEVGA